MQILSSLSGLQFSAASAGYAPTNSGDVSAIASAYQVVSATATQLYAGMAYLTSVNGAPVSASRAGNAANALLAASAWYDGTGRLISSLPDSATVSAIASSYTTGKQDTLTFAYNTADQISSINGSALGGMDEAAVSGIASAYAQSAASSKLDTSAFSAVSGTFLTAHQDLSDYQTISGMTAYQPTSAMTAYQVSGDYAFNSSLSSKLDASASSNFYGSDNPSSFITGVDLSPYQTTAGMSGYIPTSLSSDFQQVTGMSSYVPYSSIGYNTASAISGINGSALAAGSTYSAGTGIDITDDVISVEAPVDIVAGPGIVIDNPDGNTLRVSQYDPTVDVVRDCENWNGHTMKCIILRGAYTTNTTMQNQYIENVLPVGTTIAFIDGSNSYVVYGGNPQINMMVPYCIDYNRLFSPWVDITNRRVNLRYIDVSNSVTCTYYLCVKYAVD